MGHAGAWAAPGELDAAEKSKYLESAGVVVVDHPEKFGDGMKDLLAESKSSSPKVASGPGAVQKRRFHTTDHRPNPQKPASTPISPQARTLYLKLLQAFDMLEACGIPTIKAPLANYTQPIPDDSSAASRECLLSILIDRTARTPCIILSPSTDPF